MIPKQEKDVPIAMQLLLKEGGETIFSHVSNIVKKGKI